MMPTYDYIAAAYVVIGVSLAVYLFLAWRKKQTRPPSPSETK